MLALYLLCRAPMTMLRNRDRPELLLFVGRETVLDGRDLCPGVARIVDEARGAGTPAVWLADEASPTRGLESVGWPCEDPLPCPRALQLARESMVIEPDAFGGSDGFGRGRTPAKRPPLAARCVVFSASRDGCVAARSAGMRAVGVGQGFEDVSDVFFGDLDGTDDGWACDFDDLYTPGSYWINPPVPRTVDGNHCDPYTGAGVAYSAFGDRIVDAAAASSDDIDDQLTDAERAILSDLSPPPE
ncbi:hypothetical protein CTAYLR_005484 [Chrysophaeum taylorii]|uniref:Uncharacterized protein n=1 Tax=Chrysophaeum taylorii TaxID=2483200 RepID=A0AAD7U715_9STRA|nr:hypothetical protein CTAYLR_005484 [Chrysophaeum taylorii]